MNDLHDLPLILLPDRLAVCRLNPDAQLPDWAHPGDLLAFVRTREELSIVCPEKYVPPEITAERGWRVFQVQGPLDFSLVGLLAAITAPLAESGVSIFAVSTFDTDFILVKDAQLSRAQAALHQAGFTVMNYVRLST